MIESSNDNDPVDGATNPGSCPICGKPRVEQYRPFCSKRCADVDLGRWLRGDYAIPVTDDDDEDGEAAGQLPPERPDDPESGGSA